MAHQAGHQLVEIEAGDIIFGPQADVGHWFVSQPVCIASTTMSERTDLVEQIAADGVRQHNVDGGGDATFRFAIGVLLASDQFEYVLMLQGLVNPDLLEDPLERGGIWRGMRR